MTSKPQQHRPNRVPPRTVQNRIMWVLGQHGVEPKTAESIWASLATGNDPMPAGVPTTFRFEGVNLVYPSGVGTRLLYPAERKALNTALKRISAEPLDSEDNALEGRRAYTALYNRTRREGYVDPTSVKARMAELVAEACEPANEPATEALLTEVFTGTVDDLTDHAQTLIQLDNVLCGHRKPNGRLLCLQDNHHAGLHRNGASTWTETEVVKVQRFTTNTRTVKAQPKVHNGRIPDPCKVCGHVWTREYSEVCPTHLCQPKSELDDLLGQLDSLTHTLNQAR